MNIPEKFQSGGQGTDAASPRTIGKIVVLLILAGGLAYCNTLTKPFHMDDDYWIVNNDKIKDLGAIVGAYPMRAVVVATLHANYRVHGLNVFGYHLVNGAIHLGAALVLFGLVRRTLLLPRWEGRFGGSAHWLAFAIALLWMVHPLQTQAVTYIIQRCESLMGLFYLLTIYGLVRGSQAARPWPWYVASWCSCVLGIGCKEVMITAVPILLGYDRIFLASWREILRRRWVFYLGIAAIWGLRLTIVLPEVQQVNPEASAGFTIPKLPPQVYWMTQASVLLYYLRLCVIPYPQYFSYRGWELTTEFAEFWPAGLVLGLLWLGIAWLLWRRHWIGFLGLWFFGILSVTSVIPLLDVAVEHRLYLPLAAVCTLVVIGGYGLCQRFLAGKTRVAVSAALLVCAGSVCSGMTLLRNNDYRSEIQLWLPVHERFRTDHLALTNIALSYQNQDKLDEAAAYYKKCLEIAPGMFEAQYNYGILLCRNDQAAEGLGRLELSLQRIEKNPSFTEQTGLIHYELGKDYYLDNNPKLGEAHLRKAVELSRLKAQLHSGLALVLHEQNRRDEARASYQRALDLDKDWPKKSHHFAAELLYRYPILTRWTRKEALFFAKQAVQAADHNDLSMIALLAETYAANGMYKDAEEESRDARRRFPAAQNKEQLEQMARTIEYYEQQEKLKKKETGR